METSALVLACGTSLVLVFALLEERLRRADPHDLAKVRRAPQRLLRIGVL
tara:strand:- start:1135 stop:1284 length:150 start_codon:yes stop_codon:yes gene_type:complete